MNSSSPLEAIRWRGRWQKKPAPAQRSCIILALVALVATAIMLLLPRAAVAQRATPAVRGEATFNASAGYGRMVLRFAQPVDAQVRLAGGILIVTFRRPVDVPIDRINSGNADWIGAARRDPDGKALRFAIARKVKVNTTPAAERLFIDLLPEPWTADLPGLPQDVVDELARRTRAAEGVLRAQAQLAEQRKAPPIRVRVANHPTFTRYIFELSELTGVGTQRGRDTLALSFAKPLEFDLTEAKIASAPMVGSVEATSSTETATVRFAFTGQVDLRAFREDMSYVVDVTPIDKPAPKDAKAKPASRRSPRRRCASKRRALRLRRLLRRPPASRRRKPCRPGKRPPSLSLPSLSLPSLRRLLRRSLRPPVVPAAKPAIASMPNVGDEPGTRPVDKPAIAPPAPAALAAADAVPPPIPQAVLPQAVPAETPPREAAPREAAPRIARRRSSPRSGGRARACGCSFRS